MSEKCKWCNGTGNDERDEGYDSKKYPCGDCNGTGSLHAVDAPEGREGPIGYMHSYRAIGGGAHYTELNHGDAHQYAEPKKGFEWYASEPVFLASTPPSAPGMASVDAADWLMIESAPKDGTDVLLSNGVTVAQGHWLHAEGYIREHRDIEGRYIDQDESEGYDGWIDWSGGMLPEPTHWKPVPPPSAIDAARQESK